LSSKSKRASKQNLIDHQQNHNRQAAAAQDESDRQ